MATDSFKFWDSYYEALKMAPTPEDGYRLIMSLCAHVFDDEDPDFSDCPILGMAYQIMVGQAIQSRDIARRGRENGKKARGIPKKKDTLKDAKGGLKGSKKGSKTNRSEEKRSDYSNTSRLRDSKKGVPTPSADARAGTPCPEPEPYYEPYPGPIPKPQIDT